MDEYHIQGAIAYKQGLRQRENPHLELFRAGRWKEGWLSARNLDQLIKNRKTASLELKFFAL